MKRAFYLSLLILGMFLASVSQGQVNNFSSLKFENLTNTHDILLSPWGPYTKRYAGISHISDIKSGMRFDFSVLPGFYRNKLMVPNVLMDSGYYPWEFNDDLTQYSYRYELEWKDKIYVDVTYRIKDSSTVLVEMKCINNTSLPRNLDLNLMAYINYPENYPLQTIGNSPDVKWINAVTYKALAFARKRPTDNLPDSGWLTGESRDNNYVDGRAVGRNFGAEAGDKISFDFNIDKPQLLNGTVNFLYRMNENTRCSFQLNGMSDQRVTFTGTGKFEWASVPLNLSKTGAYSLTLVSEGGAPVELNGVLLASSKDHASPIIVPLNKNYIPERGGQPVDPTGDLKNLILKYKDDPSYYGIGWQADNFDIREVKNDELDIYFRQLVNDHTHKIFNGNNGGHYSNVFIRPVELNPNEIKTIQVVLCSGNQEKVRNILAEWNASGVEQRAANQHINSSAHQILPEGQKYLFSQERFKATLMNNIVYPTYTQNSFIRHFTPGKWWNYIYTWDLGFIAIGLNEVNPVLSAECINAYTTPEGGQSAFIHHGSPVPVQHYAFFDLWNKTQSKELLAYFYPRLKQYYEFLAGRLGSSTTRTKSNMIKTWDYFYNSGGWDDYPPQMAVHQQKLEKTVVPVANTAHGIRVARMLRMAAKALGEKNDIKIYDKDIRDFSEALQKYSWNENSGYFSYVVHDQNGNPVSHFTDEKSGKDYNMGFDGAYPICAGICTPEQEQILLQKIFSEQNMWTPSGMSVVDQSAPYYRIDGYWNGAIWMPHQWFAWKAMLDLGRADLAMKIATKALDVYKNETDDSYGTFEHFFAKTGRGAGWHQFSGLSAPVLSWFTSYYKEGTATTGFEIWIREQSFNEDLSSYKASLSFDDATAAHQRSMVVCMNPAYQYKITFNGKVITPTCPYKGLLEINFPDTSKDGTLLIQTK